MAVSKAQVAPVSTSLDLGLIGTRPTESRPARAPLTHPLEATLVDALLRLVQAQRQFAHELALPEAKVFPQSAGYLRSADLEGMIRRWIQDPIHGPDRIDAVIADLVGHQRTITAALDDSLLGDAYRSLAQPDIEDAPLWARVVRALLPRRWQEQADRDSSLRPLYMLAPAFVVAYARFRRTGD